MVEAGDSGAVHAMALHDEPTKWLSVVQIGITSISILNGIVGDAAFSAPFARWLQETLGMRDRAGGDHRHRHGRRHDHLPQHRLRRAGAQAPGPAVPGDDRPPGVAADGVALGRSTRPFVRLLSWCTEAVLKLLGVRGAPDRSVTEEEIAASLEEGARCRRDREAGAPDGAQRLSPRRPPGRLDDDSRAPRSSGSRRRRRRTTCCRSIAEAEHSRYPVCRGGLDDVLGIVSAQSLLQQSIQGKALRARGAPAVAGVRARDPLGHGAARAVPRLEPRSSCSWSTSTARCRG